jgi:transposase
MGNVLRLEKQEQVCALGRLGWSLRRIEEETGVRRETVSRYLKAAGIDIRRPRGRRICRSEQGSKAASQVTTDPGCAPKAASQPTTDPERDPSPDWSPRVSGCEPHRDQIESWVSRGRTASAIWQDLVDDHGFESSYECVKRFVRKLRGSGSARDPHPRIVTAPGEEAQVDYGGDGPLVRDPASGKYRRVRLFAMTLGFSRKSVWLLAPKSSSRIWSELHETAFRRLGGSSRTVVLDNLKEGVLKPDIYDPGLNPLYRDMLAHYDVVALPARVRDPNRKGKVESAVGFAQKRLRGMRFESLEEAQAYIDRWTTRWADTRIHGTTKQQVAAVFNADERPLLQSLPLEPFRYYEYGTRTVHLDGCVEVAAAYYSTPPEWLSRRVSVQWDTRHVRILNPHTGELLREHLRQRRGAHRIDDADRSKRTAPSIEHQLGKADAAGANVGAVCRHQIEQSGPYSIRRVLAILSLVKKHGPDSIDQACRAALEIGAPTYRVVKRFLESQHIAAPKLQQVDALIRDLSHYRDVINQRTETQP